MRMNILPATAQMMLTEEREAHPVHTVRWCNGEVKWSLMPEPTPDEQTMKAWEICGLQQALAWIYEGAVLSNTPMGPTDLRNANAMIISPTAVMNGRRQWYDDLPADRNPYNPENRSRISELMKGDCEP